MTDQETFTTLPVAWFRVGGMSGKMECRPISDEPPEGSVSIMYRLRGNNLRQCGVGVFKDGVWTNGAGKALDVDGLTWTRLVSDNG